MSDGTPLGSLLIDEGLLTEAQLDAAVAEQSRSGKPLGRLLIEQGTISEAELVRTLARQVGLEFVDLNDGHDRRFGRGARHRIARPPLPGDPGRLGRGQARRRDGRPVERVRGRRHPRPRRRRGHARSSPPRAQIIETIERFYRDRRRSRRGHAGRDRRGRRRYRSRRTCPRSSRTRRSSSSSTCSSPRRSATARPTSTSSRPRHDLRIRFRIDGVLHEVMRSPRSIQAGVITPPQGHGRHQHRRAPHPAGRPHHA